MMFAPSQRISASSTNNIRKLRVTSLSFSPTVGLVPSAPPGGALTRSRPTRIPATRLTGDRRRSGGTDADGEFIDISVIGFIGPRRRKGTTPDCSTLAVLILAMPEHPRRG